MATSVLARCLAEFLGTYLLVIIIASNAVISNAAWLPAYVAGTVTALTYSLYNVSGAHLNPAISIACGIAGRMGWKMVGIYLVLQLVGSALGGVTFALAARLSLQIGKSSDYSWPEAALVEVLFSTMFCFVFLCVSTAKSDKDHQFYGVAIGLALLAALLAGGHISGSVMNPAVALGWGLAGAKWSGASAIGLCPVFFILDAIGAAVAAVLFKASHHDEGGILAQPTLAHRAVAEGVGTLYLVFVVGLCNVRGTIGRAAEPLIALVSVLASMICALGDVSGGLFNPAVTLAAMSSSAGGVRDGEGPVIMAVQFAAGGLGAALFTFAEHGRAFPDVWGAGFAWLAIAIAEALFTMLLAFVALSTSPVEGGDGAHLPLDGARFQPRGQPEYAGLAVGSAAVAGGVSVGVISGAILNPALSFGIALMRGGEDQLWECILYMGFQLVGGALAARLHSMLHPSMPLGKMYSYAAA